MIVGGPAYGAAFAIDAFFFTGGATSAEVAGAAAVAALGAKYAVQSWRVHRRHSNTDTLSRSVNDADSREH